MLALVAQGKENWEIASLLYIAPGTVHEHLDNIHAKLGAHNRTVTEPTFETQEDAAVAEFPPQDVRSRE